MDRQLPPRQPLSMRERTILKEVIQNYIETGEPVSSRALSKIEKLNLSPASIRNCLADLEDLGFLRQPHTSAGRVPTDLGYRFFIEGLMRSRAPGEAEKDFIERELAPAVGELGKLLSGTSKILNLLTHHVGVVITAPLSETVLRSIEFVRVDGRRVLAVLVAESGVVVSKIVEVDGEFGGDELRRISTELTETYGGRSLSRIRQDLIDRLAEEKARYDEMLARVLTIGQRAFSEVPTETDLYVEGAASLIDQPEFHDVETMRRLFHAFAERARLVQLVNGCLEQEGVHAIIGSESSFTGANQLAIVLTHYRHPEGATGTVGIIGPTRMEYGKLFPLVGYMGDFLSHKLADAKE